MEVIEKNNEKDYNEVDLRHIFKVLWSKAWALLVSGVIVAVAAFCIATFGITPKYASSVMLYVNNGSFSLGDISINPSDLTASQSLVKTYIVILDNKTTLDEVIEKADVDYNDEELSKMIDAQSVNGTEIMKVTVTSTNPYEAAKIANCIAEVLPVRVANIIEGASMKVVDTAQPNNQKISPDVMKYTLLGFALGFVVCAIVVVALAVLDDTIRDDEYVLKTFDYPMLAKIPDLTDNGSSGYGYYHKEGGQA